MAASSQLLLLLLLLGLTSVGLACFCERYPWGSWSTCSRTCNHGIQQRQRWESCRDCLHLLEEKLTLFGLFDRKFQYDDYYWRSSCSQLCPMVEQRGCSQQSCPIDCLLTEFSSWSACSPCAKKQASLHHTLS